YDELNRIRDSRFNVFRETTNFLDRGGFQADFTLDANGNLKTLNRNDIDAVNFDALTYHYNITENNQLLGVTDAVSDPEIHPEDLESQSTANYSYDEIGNLTADAQAGTNIEWTVYGKVDEVTKGTGGTEFTYDAAGNRVKKHTTDEFGNTYTTFYIRDASGNIMSTYRSQTVGGVAEAVAVIEVPIYGSDRLGTYTPGGALENNQEPVAEVTTDQAVDSYEGVSYLLDDGVTLTLQPGFSYEDDVDGNNFSVGGSQAMEDATVADVYTRTLEKKQYELKDHLGNVRAVITDRKLSDISGSIAGNFRPQIASASAYYPYGMDLPTVRWAPETVTGTIEPENAPEEILNFDNYTDIDIVPDVNTNNNLSTRAFLLTGADGNIMGLAKSYKVQAGDKLSASVSGKYMLPNDRVDNLNVAALLVNAFINTYGGAGFYEGQLLTELGSAFEAGLASIVEDKEPNGEVTAGLSWLAFDNDFTFTGDGGFINLTAAANEDYEEISIAEHILDEDGYVFVYTSNESAQTADVYFDDLMVTLEKLIPDEAYDPDLIAYRYGFNGKEKDQMGEWGGSAAGSTVPASYPVVWTNLVGVDEQDGDIIQNVVAAAWDNAGASSENVLSAGEDGWLTFTVNESSGTTIIGFAVIDTDQTLNNVDHGILIRSDGKLNVLESGIGQIAGPERPDYSIGDELRIERANNEIIYFHNGVPIHTSGVSSNADLIVDAAIYYPNGRISEVEVSFGTQEQHDAAGQGALTAALTASYPLDGNANDVSGNGQNGTVNGAVLVADRDGNANSAYALDGEDDYLNIADNSSLDFGASDFTVSFWVQKQQATIGHTHVSGVNKWNTGGQPGTNEWSISIGDGNTNSDKPLFAVESGNDKFVLNAQTELTVGEWHHLLGVRRGDQTELYIDGVIQGTLAIGNITINDVGLPVYIGRLHAGHFSDAIFDDVFIFNRALAQTEIQQLASGQTPEEIDAMNQQSAEVASLGLAHYDYGFRIYNPALGRFLSVDPLTKGYPMLTPYQYASNTPIYAVDLDGLEGVSWSAVFKAFGVDIEINKRDSRDLEEEAAHQNELATGRARREKLGDGLQKVYDGQKAVLGFLPGASSYYSLVEGDNLEAGANLGFDLLGGRILGAAFKGLKSGAVFLLKKVTPSTNDVALDVVKYVKFDAKFSDEVADLVEGSAIRESSLTRKIKEVITFTKTGTMSDALEIAKSKVGDVTEPFINKLGPNKGRITGQGTESNHWRLDWSDEIGTHINWETATEKGAIPIKMSKEVYEKTLNTAF
ncbi:MAG: LamG-like jellyroll fold domain-containing protein, partial [Bacteroidota bacterium]